MHLIYDYKMISQYYSIMPCKCHNLLSSPCGHGWVISCLVMQLQCYTYNYNHGDHLYHRCKKVYSNQGNGIACRGDHLRNYKHEYRKRQEQCDCHRYPFTWKEMQWMYLVKMNFISNKLLFLIKGHYILNPIPGKGV